MARKKKQEEDLYENTDDELDEFLEEDEPEEEEKPKIDDWDFSEDNMASNSMEYASIVSMPSEMARNTKHVPRETRYAFLKDDEVKDIKHWDKNYRRYQYLKKVFLLQAEEDVKILNERIKLYDIRTQEQLEEYCRNTHNMIAYRAIKNKPEIIKEILEHIQTLKENGFYEDLINQNAVVTQIYADYRKGNNMPTYIDDLGMAGNIYTTDITSMGRSGNERSHTIMSIQATKDMDIKKEQEEKTEYKNKIGGWFNKFK